MIVKEPKITSDYGVERILPDSKKQVHDGIDFISLKGDRTVYSITNGFVAYDFDDYCHMRRYEKPNTGGNMIIVTSVINGLTYHIRYLHLIKNYVSKGDMVTKGMLLGEYGDVGYSFGAHVHIDVYVADWSKKINPHSILLI